LAGFLPALFPLNQPKQRPEKNSLVGDRASAITSSVRIKVPLAIQTSDAAPFLLSANHLVLHRAADV
jgi:hypothetical protein